MQALFAPNQLEQRYGGKAPNVDAHFWPPTMPSNDVGCDMTKIVSEDRYAEYVGQRPSLNRKGEEIKVSSSNQEEEVKQSHEMQ